MATLMTRHVWTGRYFRAGRMRSSPLTMGNIFNEDLRDFLAALHRYKVRDMLVGGYSVILHG